MLTPPAPNENSKFHEVLRHEVRSLHDCGWEDLGLRPAHSIALAARAQMLITHGDFWQGTEADDESLAEFLERCRRIKDDAIIDLLAENFALQAAAGSQLQEQIFDIKAGDPEYLSDKAVAILTESCHVLVRARVGYARAIVLKNRLDYDLAESTLQSALVSLDSLASESGAGSESITIPELRLRVDLLCNLGRLQVFRGNFPKALETEEAALSLATRPSMTGECYPYGEAFALKILGVVYHRLGDFARATDALLRSLEISDVLGDYFAKTACLNNLATISLDIGQSDMALEYFKRFFDLSQEDGFHVQESIAIGNIGCVLQKRGELDAAIGHYEAALNIQQRIRHIRAEAGTRANLGTALRERGRFREAQVHLETALEINRTLGDRNGAATCLINLTALLTIRNAHEPLGKEQFEFTVREYLGEAIELIGSTGTEDLLVHVHDAFAKAYKSCGDFERALHHFELFHDYKEEMTEAHALEKTRMLQFKHEMELSRKDADAQRLQTRELRAALQKSHLQRATAERFANEDILTGLPNRRHGDQVLAAALGTAIEDQKPLSIVLADADQFKAINDRYSHLVGDRVLRQLAEICRQNCRPGETAIRYGGEELLFVLPDTGLQEAVEWAERLRVSVAEYDWASTQSEQADLGLTLSLGVCSWSPPADPILPTAMLGVADAHLYEAKSAGRNCVRS